jgi:hypothetical protein
MVGALGANPETPDGQGRGLMDLPVIIPNERIARISAQNAEQGRLAHIEALQKAITKAFSLRAADAEGVTLPDSDEERERLEKVERRASLQQQREDIQKRTENFRRASMEARMLDLEQKEQKEVADALAAADAQ